MISKIIAKLEEQGGAHYKAIREYIQWHYRNGSDVLWGSEQHVQPDKSFTVKELEYLSTKIAASALDDRFSYAEKRSIHNVLAAIKALNFHDCNVYNQKVLEMVEALLESLNKGYSEIDTETESMIQIGRWEIEEKFKK